MFKRKLIRFSKNYQMSLASLTRLLAHGSIYWININTDIEDTVKPKDKIISHEKTGRLLQSVRDDIFTINNKQYFVL